MTTRPTVMIDPDGTYPAEWMYVVVHYPTGVTYGHQYGGTACRWGRVEGFLVPVQSDEARSRFDELFLHQLHGTGLWGGSKAPDDALVKHLSDAVALIRYWDANEATTPSPLSLDVARAKEIDEGWLPVITADGPGILIWPNSD